MKKMFGLVLAAALVALAYAPAAHAGVKASRHDMADAGNTYTALQAFNKYGTCSACHVPHGAGGEKLFPSTKAAAVGGRFAPLCGSCHDSSVVNNINTRYNTTVLNSSHGYAVLLLPADEAIASSGLPYSTIDAYGSTGAGRGIECLTCHDVHNQTSQRPFLNANLDNFCELCHTARENNVLANVGYANRGTAVTTHPAGPLFTGDASGGGSTIDWNGGTQNLLDNNDPTQLAGGSTWTGKDPWNSGVHKSGQSATGGVDCISCHTVHWDEERGAIANTVDYLGFVDDNAAGDSGVANLFCEYCHRGSAGGSGGGYFWNPGTTGFSHPNDDVGATATAVTVNLTWRPTTSSPRTGTGASQLTCTGCHGVHRDGAGAEVMPNTPIILNYTSTGAANPCLACHGALGMNHHPIGGSYATSGNTVGNLTCNGGNVNVGVPTCHGNGGTNNQNGAHNRSTPMSPTTNASTMCVACHTVNPSVYTVTTPYTASGSSSHFIGDASTAFPGGTQAGPRTTGTGNTINSPATWNGSGLASQYSSGDGMICESCHSLAAGNLRDGDGQSQMLLEVVGSDLTMGTGYASGSYYLCTGCHGIPAGTHPLDGASTAAYPISGSNTAGLTFTTAGLNCESCHSTHDANTQSGSYILDTTTTFNAANTNGMAVEPSIDYADFCGQCHRGFK